jgi:lipopolysaccharide/colanic/teichoic acid biosynthesis glycosyltransferase
MSVEWRRLATYEFAKRVMDVLVSGAALVVLSPVLAAVAAAVAARLGRPVIFAQERPGLHGRVFTMYKFRTMRKVDAPHGLVADGDRLTSFGRMLRSTSLDELPSLWNVLKGDMSLVGPRPLLVEYLDRYTPEQARRHEVRPGITGLAQVHGRNAVKWEDKFAWDVRYVDTRSMALDVEILLATVREVLTREGISADGQATVAEFRPGETAQREG